jgi:hypothetical protein
MAGDGRCTYLVLRPSDISDEARQPPTKRLIGASAKGDPVSRGGGCCLQTLVGAEVLWL